MNTTKHISIALNLPKVVAALLLFGRHVVQAMTNNAWFPNPDPPLNLVSVHLDALEQAEALALGRAVGAVAARDLARKAVEDDLVGLKGHALGVANQHPAQAVAIIASAGMAVKRSGTHQKPDLEVTKGAAVGEALVRAKSSGRGAAYEWQYSIDGGASWVSAGTTTVASITVGGLTVGVAVLFRFRTTLKRTTGDWSQTVLFVVH
jgi:hypothetical protein